jgi:hypothetical protein
MFQCNHHNQGAYCSCFLKLQLLKKPIKIHQCVVVWLHILVGPCWCSLVSDVQFCRFYKTILNHLLVVNIA